MKVMPGKLVFNTQTYKSMVKQRNMRRQESNMSSFDRLTESSQTLVNNWKLHKRKGMKEKEHYPSMSLILESKCFFFLLVRRPLYPMCRVCWYIFYIANCFLVGLPLCLLISGLQLCYLVDS